MTAFFAVIGKLAFSAIGAAIVAVIADDTAPEQFWMWLIVFIIFAAIVLPIPT